MPSSVTSSHSYIPATSPHVEAQIFPSPLAAPRGSLSHRNYLPQGKLSSDSCHHQLVLSVLGFHINGIVEGMAYGRLQFPGTVAALPPIPLLACDVDTPPIR